MLDRQLCRTTSSILLPDAGTKSSCFASWVGPLATVRRSASTPDTSIRSESFEAHVRWAWLSTTARQESLPPGNIRVKYSPYIPMPEGMGFTAQEGKLRNVRRLAPSVSISATVIWLGCRSKSARFNSIYPYTKSVSTFSMSSWHLCFNSRPFPLISLVEVISFNLVMGLKGICTILKYVQCLCCANSLPLSQQNPSILEPILRLVGLSLSVYPLAVLLHYKMQDLAFIWSCGWIQSPEHLRSAGSGAAL